MSEIETPPSTPSLLPNIQCTPIHTRASTTAKYNPKYEERSTVFLWLSKEMAPFFVGPMPASDFLHDFMRLPLGASYDLPSFSKKELSAMAESQENEMYNKFVRLKPHHSFLKTDIIFLGQNYRVISSQSQAVQHVQRCRHGPLQQFPFHV